jgi:HAD superfamily hydrolase (TIGR01458 family)
MTMPPVEGLLLDIDGVLVTSWQPIPGAVEAVAAIERAGVPFCLITNTTTHSRNGLADQLRSTGFEVSAERIVTAVTATAAHLRSAHPGASAFVLTDGDPRDDLEGVAVCDEPEEADVMVLGGASDDFSYDLVNRVFRRLMDGAPLVAMHRNLYWRTARGWELDGGAFVAGLEVAAGIAAVSCGKPAREFFEAAVQLLGMPAARAAMVGDDIANDVEGARAAGLVGILVRTGKFRADDLEKGSPDAILDSLADLPAWLGLPG